jgi:hypothetical protein
MHSFSKAFVVCALVALATTATGAYAHDEATEDPVEPPTTAASAGPALLTFEQAKARGLDVTSGKESGLPECPSVPYVDTGSTSDEDAAAASILQNRADVPRCIAPAKNMRFGVGTPPPHAGTTLPGFPNSYYHWTGWNTYGHNHWGEGLQFQIEVANPSVAAYPGNGYEFVAARVMLIDENDDWTEAGWYEYNYFTGNDQCVYGYATPEHVHHFDCSSYPLTVGSLYTFRTEQVAANGVGGVGGFVYYAGAWRQLVYNDEQYCVTTPGGAYCYLDVELEVETDLDPSRHVVLNGEDFDDVGVTFHLGQVKKIGDNSWNSVSSYNNCSNMEINNASPSYKVLKRGGLDIRNSFRVAKVGTAHTDCP